MKSVVFLLSLAFLGCNSEIARSKKPQPSPSPDTLSTLLTRPTPVDVTVPTPDMAVEPSPSPSVTPCGALGGACCIDSPTCEGDAQCVDGTCQLPSDMTEVADMALPADLTPTPPTPPDLQCPYGNASGPGSPGHCKFAY